MATLKEELIQIRDSSIDVSLSYSERRRKFAIEQLDYLYNNLINNIKLELSFHNVGNISILFSEHQNEYYIVNELADRLQEDGIDVAIQSGSPQLLPHYKSGMDSYVYFRMLNFAL